MSTIFWRGVSSVQAAIRIAGISLLAVAVAGGIAVMSSRHGVQSWSIGTAYSALCLVAYALVLGPVNVIRGQPNPVHNAFRRDVGISAGIVSILHTILGLQVHMGGDISRYFLRSAAAASTAETVFLAANWTGLLSVLVFACVTAVSNDPSLRSLGLQKWKTIQRFVYPAAALAVIHGFAYQALEKRSSPAITLVAALALLVFALQIAGMRAKHRNAVLRVS